LSGVTPAPATNFTVNGQPAQTYGDFTFARTNLTLANGQNTFTNIAQNVYGVAVTNTFTVNLPQSVNLGLDNNGNLTNDGTRSFNYNTENELTNIFVAGQWRSDFIYDGLGRRRIARDYSWNGSAWLKTNEVRYIYDGYLILQERDTNNNPLVTYTRGLDLSRSLQDAGGVGGLLARTDANGSTFYHADGAGNITALMDGGENIVARYLYGPFGKLTGMWGSLAPANEMRFSSKPSYHDIYDFGFRWYVPDLDRFSNQDPLQEAGGINLYRLGFNNPLHYIDRFGLQADDIEIEPARSEVNPAEETSEDQMLDRLAGEQSLRERGLDPNQTYIGSANPTVQPETEAQIQSDIQRISREITDEYAPKVANPPASRVNCSTENQPSTIYRAGRPSPSNLKPRPGEDALSFRNSLSNPLPNTGRPVFRPGDDYFGIDPSKLPPGSVIHDNAPPGHVSVQGVPPDVLKNAVTTKGSFPE
jgi:RHS repeat-associated protein